MAEGKTREGKSYKEQLNAVVSAASKMIKQTAEASKIKGLISKETPRTPPIQSDNE